MELYKILYNGNVVAKQIEDGGDFIKESNNAIVPATIFGIYGDKRGTFEKFKRWCEDRVFSKYRPDCKELLKSMNLDKYNELDIAKVTKAVSISDKFSIDWEEK